jgi:hypothetical protein
MTASEFSVRVAGDPQNDAGHERAGLAIALVKYNINVKRQPRQILVVSQFGGSFSRVYRHWERKQILRYRSE